MIYSKIEKSDIEILTSPKEIDFFDCWNKAQYLSSFEEGRFFGYIVRNNEQTMGFITLTMGVDDADIESVYVFSKYRKLGVAVGLIEKCFERLKGKVKKIFLEVRKGNIPAINLYKKCGFSQISTRKKYYEDGEDALVFVKEL